MTRQPLDDHLRAYYADPALDGDALVSLRKAIAGTPQSAPAGDDQADADSGDIIPLAPARLQRRRTMIRWSAAAAVLVAGVVVALLAFGPVGGPDGDVEWVKEAVSAHIAERHRLQPPVPIKGDSLPALQQQMDKLAFYFRPPTRHEVDGMRIDGARYCELIGNTAAHVALTDADGARLSLFASQYTYDFCGLKHATIHRDGLTIELWTENGVFYGLARPDAGDGANGAGGDGS